MRICPQCRSPFDVDTSSEYQVNDNFDLTFCCYQCSLEYTAEHIWELLPEGLTLQEVHDNI